MSLAYIGKMRLSDYMAKHDLIDEDVATMIGVSRPTVTRWRNGSLLPSLRSAGLIWKFTKGRVTPDDWLPQIEAAE